MAKSPFAKRDEHQELSRRALIKWTVAAGAALGVSRSKIFEILEKTAGKGVAQAASATLTTRSVHMNWGNGALSWCTLMWPHLDVAAAANPAFAYQHPGMTSLVTGTDFPLAVGPDTPFQSLPASKQVTAYVNGQNTTHNKGTIGTITLNNNNIFAVASALQASSPAVIPLITVGPDVTAGTAPGSATPANVATGDGIVSLFNSAASQAGGLLAMKGNAALYKAQYDGFAQLNRAANRSTTKLGYTTASGAAGFLGTNLATQLAITPADLTRYGITGATKAEVTTLAHTLIVTAKAFGLGLTNAVLLPVAQDDPHGAFDTGEVMTVPAQWKGVLDGFMGDLMSINDTASGQPLANDTVITFQGDTTKDSLSPVGWGDGTISNHCVTYVYGAGYLKSGWFQSAGVQRGGTLNAFDATGKPFSVTKTSPYDPTGTEQLACASIGYAIAKGDDRAIGNFSPVVVSGVTGNPQTT